MAQDYVYKPKLIILKINNITISLVYCVTAMCYFNQVLCKAFWTVLDVSLYKINIIIIIQGLRTALHTSAEKGHRGLVNMLVTAHAPLDVQDADGNTPLLLAALNQHEEIVRALIRAGSDVRITGSLGKSVLHYACSSGFVDVVHEITNLVDDDDLDRPDVNGSTPLTLAVQQGHVTIMKHLVTRNCEVRGRVCRTATSELSLLAMALRDGFTDLVPVLLSAGSDVNCFRKLQGLCLVSPAITANDVVMKVLWSHMNNIRSLEFHSRIVVRQCLGRNITGKIQQLPIPQTLKEYVLLQEELQWTGVI